jgi:hypothetical protein
VHEVVEPDHADGPFVAAHRHELELGPFEAAGEVGDEVTVAELVGGHEHLRAGLAQDVVDLLGPVEVHDRYEHDTEHRRAVERDPGLEAVRHLERDDVALFDAARREAGREPAGELVEVAHRVTRRPGV